MDYALMDSGDGKKLERFGSVTCVRPCMQALWSSSVSSGDWERADAIFSREKGWHLSRSLPETWEIAMEKICFKLRRTPFGHLGVFPEQASLWKWILEEVSRLSSTPHLLNLFAHSGSATLAAALGGAAVTHVDSAKGIVTWARENAALNGLTKAPIRWIVEDVSKFVQRCLRKKETYDAIILDPPSFGRGKSGQVFKIEKHLPMLLKQCFLLLSKNPLFLILSCHTPGYSPLILKQLVMQIAQRGKCISKEMLLKGKHAIPAGSFLIWQP